MNSGNNMPPQLAHNNSMYDKKLAHNMMSHNESQQQPTQMSNEISVLDMLTQILSKESVEPHSQEPENKETEHFWSGFITRNKQHRVGVDATLVSGEEISLVEYNLNISHRTVYDEVLKKKPKAVAVFTPSNETQNNIFVDYINYFNEKQRAGVVTIRNYLLYLLPPGDESKKIHEIKDLQILGVFADINAPNNDGNNMEISGEFHMFF